MKKLFLSLALLTLTFTGLGSTFAFADANDFYFKSFTGDYYLDDNSAGPFVTMSTDDAIDLYFSGEKKDTAKEISEYGHQGNLQIEETLVAVFPSTNQNHGIDRCIPYDYMGSGALDTSSFTVLQDGEKVDYTSRLTSDGFQCLRIGNANTYVHGEVTYTISYNYNNVIVKYADADYQELYWDTNGTSWSQRFQSLTARLHIPVEFVEQLTDNPFSCYVGAHGESGQNRCTISQTAEGDGKVITFSAQNLSAGENLTFNATFKNDTFTAIAQTKSYLLIIIAVILTIIFAAIIALMLKKRAKQSDKIKLAKDKTIPVQYIPLRGFTVAEMGKNYLKSTSGSLNVASLIELATSHKIELEKGEKKTFGGYKWTIHVKDMTDVTKEQETVLKILNGGSNVSTGDTIEVKKRTSTATLQLLARSYNEQIESSLEQKGLREPSAQSKTSTVLTITIIIVCLCFTFPSLIVGVISSGISNITSSHSNIIYVGQVPAFIYIVVAFIAFIITAIVIASSTYTYKQRTLEGIKASKYLDGLKEYMTLAEADRIKFIQSVKGADTSNQGIVKLWEKLLPYAVIFGIEDSWMDELNRYYQMDDVTNPYWLHGTTYFPVSDFHSFTSYTSSSISSSTASSSSGGSSGGGGGGFSGGGGGGGGGGGW